MGTTKSGRYINTKGSGRSASDFAVVHSNEGAYTHPKDKNRRIRLANGGHGQTGMNELDKYGIEYHIVKTYPNGVRVGYVPDHKDKKNEAVLAKHGFLKIGRLVILGTLESMLQGSKAIEK